MCVIYIYIYILYLGFIGDGLHREGLHTIIYVYIYIYIYIMYMYIYIRADIYSIDRDIYRCMSGLHRSQSLYQ